MESGERSCDKVWKYCVGHREEVWGVRERNRSVTCEGGWSWETSETELSHPAPADCLSPAATEIQCLAGCTATQGRKKFPSLPCSEVRSHDYLLTNEMCRVSRMIPRWVEEYPPLLLCCWNVQMVVMKHLGPFR